MTARLAEPARSRSKASSIASSGSRCEIEPVERQPAAAVQVEDQREVARRARTSRRSAPRMRRSMRGIDERGQPQLGVGARDADQHGRAARARGEERGAHAPRAGRSPRSRSRRRRRLTSAPRAAVSSASPGPATASRRAELQRAPRASRRHVHGHDRRRRPRRPRPCTAREPDAAAADHRHAVARPHAGGAPDGADPGGHGAAHERGDVQRHVRRRSARRSAPARPRARRTSRAASSGSTGSPPRDEPSVPSSSPPAPIAGQAVRQRWRRSRRHSSQRPQAGAHESATGLPGAQPRRRRRPPRPRRRPRGRARRAARLGRAVDRVQVGVADAARVQAHEHLAGARRRELQPRSTSCARPSAPAPRRGSSGPPAGRRVRLQLAQLLDRDVAAHEVAGLDLDRAAAPRCSQIVADLARAAGVEDAAGRRVGVRSGSRPRAGSAGAPSASIVGHRREQRLGVGVVRPAEHDARPARSPSGRPRYSTAMRSER